MLVIAFIPFILAVLQGIAPTVSKITGWGLPIESINTYRFFPSEMPSDFAFNLWFVLFLMALVYSVGQLLPGLRQNTLVKQLRGYAIGLFATSTLWMLTAQLLGNGWWLIALIWCMWLCALGGLLVLLESEHRVETFHQWVSQPLFGLYAGWLSVAVWLNTSNFIQFAFDTRLGLSPVVYALLFLTTIVAFSTTVLLQTNGCRWFGSALLWALYAILWHNLIDQFNAPVAIFTSVSIVLVYTLLAITPISRLFRYVRRTHMREWMIRSLALKALQTSKPSFYTVKQTLE
jgi:hypothetical protein